MPGGQQKVFHLTARFVVAPATLEAVRACCTLSGKFSWLAGESPVKTRIHTLKGVPAKLIDVCLPDEMPAGAMVCEVGDKAGRYDGRIRQRIALRPWQHVNTEGRPPSWGYPAGGSLKIVDDGDGWVIVARWWDGGSWLGAYERLNYAVAPGPRQPILMRQRQLYFGFLPVEDALALADYWSVLPAVQAADDINLLNRLASDALYDLARQLGWRKLTLREKRKLGLADNSPQWHRADSLLLRRSTNLPGVGQHTVDAGRGRPIHLPRGVCPQCQELESECHCH